MLRKGWSVVVRVAAVLAAVGCSGSPGAGSLDAGAGGAGSAGRAGANGGSGGIASSGGAGGSAGAGSGGAGANGSGGAGGIVGSGGAGGGGSGGAGGTAGSGGAGGTADAGAGGAGGTTPCTATTLKAAAACTGRLFGAALAASHLSESGYTTAARELSFVTPENEMKWDQIEPTQGNFTFGPADQIVTFAMQNGMKIKGHTLVWHKQLPAYVTNLTAAADVRSAMLEHINGVISHYKGKVAAWDVVNEAWITTGATGNGNPMLRASVFSNALGQAFIDDAFTAARQADPAALLIYNEFADEGLSDKATAVYGMVMDMKTRGIPIDGIGFQMHIGINTAPTPDEVTQNMQRFAALGVQIFISEMDVNTCAGYSLDQETTQYHDMVAACVAQPACAAVTVWGITDKFSWLNVNVNSSSPAGCATGVLPAPLLWDANYVKKSAYTGAMDALLGQ